MFKSEQFQEKKEKFLKWIKKHYLKCLIIVNILLMICFVFSYVKKVNNLLELEFTFFT